jgi:hypothetical protein
MCPTEDPEDPLTGVLHLFDGIQDQAIDEHSVLEDVVFGEDDPHGNCPADCNQ